ncbi:MAG: AMP-binding protein [Pyrinomonadaceae bacterium]|nr:AMP-binding protein [Phycisphaerales bacterium]
MSVHWPIIKTLLRRPFKEAIVDDTRTYRGIDILVAASHVAAALQSVSTTGTVGILLPTGGAFPIAALAGWMLGKTIVPLNYLLKQDELQYVIDDCGCDTVITASALLGFLGFTPDRVKLVKMDEISFKGMPDARWPAGASDDDLAVILYTSGTSGKPKGVMLTHGNIRANVSQIDKYVQFGPDQVFLGVLPQFHSFGLTVLTVLPLTFGWKAVYTARFAPAKLIRLLKQHHPTVFVAIPSMYNALLHVKDARPEDFTSLKFVLSGAEPLPQAVADGFLERFGVRINEGYGLTETAPATNWCLPTEYRPRSVGRPLTGITERIVDINTGKDVPFGEEGEIRIAGENVMRGYYKLPAETAAAFDEQGALRTGDIGRFDADGHLYITGRLKEMLIIGGENVFPREIEEVLNKHPDVKDSGVIGVPDPMRGEEAMAFVEMKEAAGVGKDGAAGGTDAVPKRPFDQKVLLHWCRQHLAGYKVPREIREIEALPRSATGKVLRRELKKLAG